MANFRQAEEESKRRKKVLDDPEIGRRRSNTWALDASVNTRQAKKGIYNKSTVGEYSEKAKKRNLKNAKFKDAAERKLSEKRKQRRGGYKGEKARPELGPVRSSPANKRTSMLGAGKGYFKEGVPYDKQVRSLPTPGKNPLEPLARGMRSAAQRAIKNTTVGVIDPKEIGDKRAQRNKEIEEFRRKIEEQRRSRR